MLISRHYWLGGSSPLARLYCNAEGDPPPKEGGGSSDPPKDPPHRPASKHDEPLDPKLETFGRAYVEELRGENAHWRTKFAEADRKAADATRIATEAERKATEAAEKAAKAAKDTETAVDTARKEERTAAQDRVMRAELMALALKEGLIDKDGLKLIDLSKVKMKDDGTLEGAEEAIAEGKKAKPYLFGTAEGTTNTKTTPPKTGETKPFDAKTASDDDYKAAKRKVIAGGTV